MIDWTAPGSVHTGTSNLTPGTADWYNQPSEEAADEVVVDNLDTCSRCHETKPRSWCRVCEADYKHTRQQTPAYKAWRRTYQHAHPETWGYGWLGPAPSDAEQEAMAWL